MARRFGHEPIDVDAVAVFEQRIGTVVDDDLELLRHGFVKKDGDDDESDD